MIKELKCSSATVTASYARFRRLIIASLGDLNRCDASYAHNHELLRLNIPKGARKVHYVDHMMVAMWRERHRDNLWGAFMDVLKIVKADDCGGGEGRQTSGMVVDGIMNDGFTLPLEVTADTAIDQDDDLPRTKNTQHSESRKRSHSDISETVLVVMETTALGEGGLFCYMANTEEKAIELLTEYGLLYRPKHVIVGTKDCVARARSISSPSNATDATSLVLLRLGHSSIAQRYRFRRFFSWQRIGFR